MLSSTHLQVALSYSRRNTDAANHIISRCKAQQIEVWYDMEDIRPTSLWRDEIRNGILGSSCMICLISKDYLASEYCLDELEFALNSGKKIVAAKYPDVTLQELPAALQSIQFVSLNADASDETNYTNILSAVHLDIEWHNKKVYIDLLAKTWKLLKKRKSAFLHGGPLEDAETWLDKADPQKDRIVTDEQRDYIIASRRAEARRYLRFALIGLVLMTGFYFLQNDIIYNLQFNSERLTMTQMAFFSKEKLQAVINGLDAHGILLFKISISWSFISSVINTIVLGAVSIYFIIALKRRKPLFSKMGIGILVVVLLVALLQTIENITFLNILSTRQVTRRPFFEFTTTAKATLMMLCIMYFIMGMFRMTLFSKKWRTKTAKRLRV
jgi:hypothetical protein